MPFRSHNSMKDSQGGKAQSPSWGKKLNSGSTHTVPYLFHTLFHWILPVVLWGTCHYPHHFKKTKSRLWELREVEWVTPWIRRDLLPGDQTRKPMQLPLPFCSSVTWTKISGGRWVTQALLFFPPPPSSFSTPFFPPLLLLSLLPPFLLSFLLISGKDHHLTMHKLGE